MRWCGGGTVWLQTASFIAQDSEYEISVHSGPHQYTICERKLGSDLTVEVATVSDVVELPMSVYNITCAF